MSHNFTSCEYMGLELDAAKFQTEEKKRKKKKKVYLGFYSSLSVPETFHGMFSMDVFELNSAFIFGLLSVHILSPFCPLCGNCGLFLCSF